MGWIPMLSGEGFWIPLIIGHPDGAVAPEESRKKMDVSSRQKTSGLNMTKSQDFLNLTALGGIQKAERSGTI